MSQKKQRAQEKAQQKKRMYPHLQAADVEARLNIAQAFASLAAEELSNLPFTEKLADNARPMRGAHLTIGHYTAEVLFHELARELELIESEADIIRLVQPAGLVGIDGEPLKAN